MSEEEKKEEVVYKELEDGAFIQSEGNLMILDDVMHIYAKKIKNYVLRIARILPSAEGYLHNYGKIRFEILEYRKDKKVEKVWVDLPIEDVYILLKTLMRAIDYNLDFVEKAYNLEMKSFMEQQKRGKEVKSNEHSTYIS